MPDPDYSFAWAIAPQTPETFFAEYFEHKPLVVRRNMPSYYKDLLCYDDIDRVISTMGLSVPDINLTRADSTITAPDFSHESGLIDPVRVAQLFADGATVILSGLQGRLPKLAQFCRAMESVMSCGVQTNIYLTPVHSQGFRPHYDSHDVMVLQVEGTKEWRFYNTPLDLPLRSQGFDPHATEIGEETERFVLEPGDMVYVPRGLVHDAVATDQTSLHITTGLMAHTWADLLIDAVATAARADRVLRHALPPGFANDGFDATIHRAFFDDLITRFAQTAPLSKLMEGFKQDFLTTRAPQVPQQMTQIAMMDDLTIDAHVGARANLIYDLTHMKDEQQVRLICNGAEIVLPDHALAPLRYAISTPSFRISELPGTLDDAGKITLVRRLVREGLIVIHQTLDQNH